MPKTGQPRCWDGLGNPIDCAGTGQDGELQKGVSTDPRFTDNGDGTVQDNLTGLIWLKDANCSVVSPKNFANAFNAVSRLQSGQCGLTDGSAKGDWRLPTKAEWQALVNTSCATPALPNAAGTGCYSTGAWATGVQLSGYWSSTTFATNPGIAWGVDLNDGYVSRLDKSFTYYVWPVRGGP